MVKYTVDTPYPVGPVHLYVFEHREGLILFDTGPPTPESFSYLENNIPLRDLKYVFVTHAHADHCGGLEFISKRSNAKLFVPGRDIMRHRKFDEILPRFKNFLSSLGFPQIINDSVGEVLISFRKHVVIPEGALPAEKSGVAGLGVMPFPGHSMTDFVYTLGNVAVTGDFLLNGIFQTPLVDIDPYTMEVFDNYRAYCGSISRLGLISHFGILPGHGDAADPVDVVESYVTRVLKRAEALRECLEGRCTVFEAVKTIVDPFLDPFRAYLKASEILFFKALFDTPQLLGDALRKAGIFDRLNGLFSRVIK